MCEPSVNKGINRTTGFLGTDRGTEIGYGCLCQLIYSSFVTCSPLVQESPDFE